MRDVSRWRHHYAPRIADGLSYTLKAATSRPRDTVLLFGALFIVVARGLRDESQTDAYFEEDICRLHVASMLERHTSRAIIAALLREVAASFIRDEAQRIAPRAVFAVMRARGTRCYRYGSRELRRSA